ncbi:MAG: hypothetical protein ACHP7N_13975 [Caulobacterales bacterium]
MSKYENLGAFLKASGADEIPLTFDQVEQIVGATLPDSQRYPAWWSNNPSNNVMTRIWLEAGYRTEGVDITGRKLVFRRATRDKPPLPSEQPRSRRVGDVIARLRQALGGTVRVAEGVDLTEPTGEVWDAESQ